MSDTISIPKEEYMTLKRENTFLKRELGYVKDGTIPRLLLKLKSAKHQESKGEVFTLKDIQR